MCAGIICGVVCTCTRVFWIIEYFNLVVRTTCKLTKNNNILMSIHTCTARNTSSLIDV